MGVARLRLQPFLGRPVVCTSMTEYYDHHAGAWRPRLPDRWRYDPYVMFAKEAAA